MSLHISENCKDCTELRIIKPTSQMLKLKASAIWQTNSSESRRHSSFPSGWIIILLQLSTEKKNLPVLKIILTELVKVYQSVDLISSTKPSCCHSPQHWDKKQCKWEAIQITISLSEWLFLWQEDVYCVKQSSMSKLGSNQVVDHTKLNHHNVVMRHLFYLRSQKGSNYSMEKTSPSVQEPLPK